MCGYSGFIYTNSSAFYLKPHLQQAFYLAAENISYRGNEPLRKKYYEHVLLAHTRLSFQDAAKNVQPLVSQDGIWTIIFNGEIYNFKNLRLKLQQEFNYVFMTDGDTEVILAGFLCYGTKICDYLEGEYAFVIFKTDGSEVFAARDSFGVKPLFIALENVNTNLFSVAQKQYLFQTPSLNFSSEIKGLFYNKKWDRDGFLRQAVGLYEPIRTPFAHIIALPANSYLHAKKSGEIFCVELQLKFSAIRKPSALNINYSLFQEYLQNSVRERTLSDVELGVYLSGGIDSKVICYELVEQYKSIQKNSPLKAFHISFSDKKYDESEEVKRFSKHLKLNLNIIKIEKKSLDYSYPIAVYHSENIQPYTNGAAKWWLSLFASRQVKGVLTGDGADEILCGYPSFQYANWWKFALRNRAGNNVFEKLNNLSLGKNWRDFVYQKKIGLNFKNPWEQGLSHTGMGNDFIESLALWGVPHPLFEQVKTIACSFLGEHEGLLWLQAQKESIRSWFTFGLESSDEFLLNPENTLLLWQNYFCKTHLPVQVLNWVGDRMEMANTLEGRTPFLSRHLKDYIYNLPDYMLVNGFCEKYILRNNYKDKLRNFITTPKKQFNSPLLAANNKNTNQHKIIEQLNNYNLVDKASVIDLFNNKRLKENSFINTSLAMAIQTLESFSLVDNFLIHGHKPKRDLAYEEMVMATKGNN